MTSPARCNLRCSACRDHSPFRERAPGPGELAFEVVARVIDEQRGRGLEEVIPCTRGEPLLWPGFAALAGLCEERGVLLNVTTNGTFPRLGARGWAARLAAAASDVKVSWSGACAETAEALMEGLRFDAAVDGVRELVAARDARRARGQRATRVSFQVTARERNVEELPAIVSLAARLGVDRVKVNQLQVHFPAMAEEDLRRSPESRARWNASVQAAHEVARRHLATGERIALENVCEMGEPAEPGAAGQVREPAALAPCPFLGREAWILQDGSFAPCPAPAGLDGLLGDFGSVLETTLAEIWEGQGYRGFVASAASRAECLACAVRRPGGV